MKGQIHRRGAETAQRLRGDVEKHSTLCANSANALRLCGETQRRLRSAASFAFIVTLMLSISSFVSAQRRQQATGNSNASAQNTQSLSEAAALLQAGRLEEADAIVRRVLKSVPKDAEAHNLLGVILDQRGRAEEAEREYLESLRLNPKGFNALANLGVLLARTGRTDQAVNAFESVLRAVPDHEQALFNLGLLYLQRGDNERAAQLFERANALRPNAFEILYRLGLARFNLKQLNEAARALESASTLAPASPEPLYYLGLIASARGQSEEAVGFWQKALKLRANFAEANFMLGEELRKQGRADLAKDFYERALAEDPAKPVYYIRLGGAFMLLNFYDRALETFQKAAERFPEIAEVHYFVGIAARGRGEYETSETALRKSLALKADNPDALAQLGFIVGERGRFAEAGQLLERAITLSHEKHFYALYDMGRLLVKTRKYEEAIPILEKGAALRPKNSGIHYQLFMAFSRLKRKTEAERELALFKQLDEERKKRRRDENSIEDDMTDDAAPVKQPSTSPE